MIIKCKVCGADVTEIVIGLDSVDSAIELAACKMAVARKYQVTASDITRLVQFQVSLQVMVK